MTVYQEPGTERTVDVDEADGELLLALGWTVAPLAADDALAASLASEVDGKHRSTVLAFNPCIPTDADDLLGEAE